MTRRLAMAVGVVLAALAGRWIDLPTLAGPIKGDEATYIAMALSAAEDGDLRYEPEDYQRFVEEYRQGPGGIFLKRRYTIGLNGKTAVPTTESLAYAKAFVYPVVAAPFVALGGLGGLVTFNWVLVAVIVACGAAFCQTFTTPLRAWLVSAGFFGAAVVPVYVAWATPELFNVALVTVGYFLWIYKKVRPGTTGWLGRSWTTLAGAALLGVATFSKPTHAALVLPLLFDALATRRLIGAVVLGAVCTGTAAGLYGVNGLITGEVNYQGAADAISRRSFADTFPFDERGTTFEGKGSAMVTNDADTGRVLAPDALAQVPVNVWYFLAGRHAGLVPYFLPGVVWLLVWALRARHAPLWQWGIAIAVLGSAGALIVLAPDSWNGGGGPPGNRYFLSLYPPLLFLAWPVAPVGATLLSFAGLAFVGPLLIQPYAASAATWRNVEREPLKSLPVELTLVNDLPCRLNTLRCPILWFREPAVQFYYLDANTYSAEGDGTWIAGNAGTDIIVKTDRAPARVRFEFSGPIANQVTGRLADREFSASVPAGGTVAVTVTDPAPFRYHQNWVYVLHLETTAGFVPAEREPGSKDTRNLGVFVRPTFIYADGTVSK